MVFIFSFNSPPSGSFSLAVAACAAHIWGQTFLCCKDCPVHCRVVNDILGPDPLNVSGTALLVGMNKNVSRCCLSGSGGEHHPKMRNTGLHSCFRLDKKEALTVPEGTGSSWSVTSPTVYSHPACPAAPTFSVSR